MKPMSPIPSPNERKSKLMPICNQDEFFMELKEIKHSLTLEEVFPPAEVPEELRHITRRVQKSWARQTF